ncbi:YciI family protein [Actinoplanes sp. NPDC051633]|uniref:YciI family protein n=1 Tax=Actinoplanes sp. NPDC051633 TaxID=3155670 RepID=UPI00342B5A3D
MQYALLIYGDEKRWQSRTDAEMAENHVRHQRFMQLLQQRDAMRGGAELEYASSAATTVRDTGGDVTVTDGPFAEAAEQLGGFYLVEAADLDDAISLAKALPEGIVEIRPIVPARG